MQRPRRMNRRPDAVLGALAIGLMVALSPSSYGTPSEPAATTSQAASAKYNWLQFGGDSRHGNGIIYMGDSGRLFTAFSLGTVPPIDAGAPPDAGSSGALPRVGWLATASASGGGAPANALDGHSATRWSTGAAQANGQWFHVDMTAAHTFNQIALDAASNVNDYPRGYQVFVSNDGVNFGNAVATGAGTTALVTVTFAAQTARYVKVVQTSMASFWWSIAEFNVYNTGAAQIG